MILGSILSLCCAVHAAPTLRAEASIQQEEVTELAARLRNPKLTLDERVALEERLLLFGESGARALQRIVEERIKKCDERARKSEKTYLAELEKSAAKLVSSRLDKPTLAEVDKLRKQVNDLRRDEQLSKERIHAEGDPARELLRALLEVHVDHVLEAQPELAKLRESIGTDLYELEQDFGLWMRCNFAMPEKKRSKAVADPIERWPAVQSAEAWVCMLATPMTPADREVLTKNRALAAELPEPEETAGVLDLNRLRILLGLNALLLDVKLCAASRDHSNDMRTLGFFDHQSPVEGKKTPWDRAARFGTTAGAENIAAGHESGASANLGWWYSPGHHKNMLGGHARVGLGRSEGFWTQMFG
jgi:hypothetical protein